MITGWYFASLSDTSWNSSWSSARFSSSQKLKPGDGGSQGFLLSIERRSDICAYVWGRGSRSQAWWNGFIGRDFATRCPKRFPERLILRNKQLSLNIMRICWIPFIPFLKTSLLNLETALISPWPQKSPMDGFVKAPQASSDNRFTNTYEFNGFHKCIRSRIEAVGASVRSLPPHSPGMNKLELQWAVFKARLRNSKYQQLNFLKNLDQHLNKISK